MSKVLAAAGLIIYRLNGTESGSSLSSALRYLMLQTSYGEHHWTPPKGHVDPGEQLLETAIRETVEESGLTPESFAVDRNFPPIELKYVVKNNPKTVTYWLARANESAKVRLSDEHQYFRWCSVDEACSLVGYADMQEALKKAHCYLLEHIKEASD